MIIELFDNINPNIWNQGWAHGLGLVMIMIVLFAMRGDFRAGLVFLIIPEEIVFYLAKNNVTTLAWAVAIIASPFYIISIIELVKMILKNQIFGRES